MKDVETYITDGTDDSSCDIIYDNIDSSGRNVFYVIQAKWCTKSNIGSEGLGKEIKACLSDFTLILEGKKSKSKINEKFNNKYENHCNTKKQTNQ